MAPVTNLRSRRKQKQREDKARQAQQNRARHGRTPAQRQQDEDAARTASEHLDQLRRERDADGDGPVEPSS